MRNTFNIQEETSLVQESTAITLNRPVVLVPIFSAKGYGDDNTLRYLTGLSDLSKYGEIDFDHYGINMILAKKILGAGGTVLTQRLINDGDLCANFICNISHDSTDVDDFAYTMALATGTGVVDFNALVTAVDGELDIASATKVYPLFGLMNKSKGSGGNDISIRLVPNADMTDYLEAQVYTMEIYDAGTKLYSLEGTFTRQAFGASPMYFPEVIRANTEEFMMYLPDYSDMITAIEAQTTEKFQDVDIIGGTTESMLLTPGADFSAVAGVSLANGSVAGEIDGVAKFTDAAVQTEVDSLLTAFFNGTTNPELFNRLKYKIDLVVDPGYAVAVNKVVANSLLVKNEAIQFFANLPKATTYSAVLANASSTYTDIEGTNITMYGNYFSAFMAETSRYMEVPATLYSVEKIIDCFQKGTLFAGKQNIKITGYEKVIPSVFEKDEIDALIKYRVNMFGEIGIGIARPESEITFRLKLLGPLSSTANRVMLNDMMKIADEKAENNIHLINFDYNKYAEALRTDYLLEFKSGLKSVIVTAKRQGGNGLDQNNTAVTVEVTFANSTDGFKHTFVVNKSE